MILFPIKNTSNSYIEFIYSKKEYKLNSWYNYFITISLRSYFVMNIQSLKYFLAIDKYKNFSKASDELSLSQSSLSKHIKALESELNCILFDRSTKYLELTEAGVVFKKYAIKAMENHTEMLLDIKKLSKCKHKLFLGYMPVISQYKFSNIIGLYTNKFPEVELNLKESEHNDIIEMLTKKEIDLALLRSETILDDLFEKVPLVTDELVLVVPKSHPLSNKKYISFSSLTNERFILLGEKSGVYDTCVNEARKAGFELNISCLNSRIENILGLVSAGLGVSLIMKKAVDVFKNDNIQIILLKERIKSTLSLVYIKNKVLSKEEKDFINLFVSHFPINN